MPPKKSKKKEVVEEVVEEPEVETVVAQQYHQIDLINDLNDDFFSAANKVIQVLVEDNKMEVASEVKKFVVILSELHEKYVQELDEKNIMKPKLVEADDKLNIALKLTGESQECMNALKLALESAWRDADASRTREQGFQDQLREMILKCAKLQPKLDKGGKETDDTTEFGHLAKYKQIILKERDRLNGEVIELTRRVQMQRLYIESLEKVWQNAEEINDKQNKRILTLETEKAGLEKKIRTTKEALEECREVNRNLLLKGEIMFQQINEYVQATNDLTKQLDRVKLKNEKYKSELALMSKTIAKNKTELHLAIEDRKVLQELSKDMKNEIKMKNVEILQLNKKYHKAVADYDMQANKVTKMDRNISNLKEEIVTLNNEKSSIDKDRLETIARCDALKRTTEMITHERDHLRVEVTKMGNQLVELKHTIVMKTNLIDSIQLDLKKQLFKLEEANKQISRVEKERDEQIQESQLLQDKIDNLKEQHQLKSDQVIELQNKLDIKQAAYVKIQKLLETTNSERLMLQRSLQTCCEERTNLKTLLAKATHQITQLTEEITTNQNKINSLNLKIDHLRSEKQEVETELKNTRTTLKNTRQELKEMKEKNEGLQKIIAEDELRFLKLSVQLEALRKEKNLIGLQMVRRNDEIILLKEKLMIFQDALDKGQTQYNQRLEDIRLLKLEISSLQTQRDVLKKGIDSTADMREEVVRLQRLLNQEQVRNRVLMEDLKTPANVHRWRILGGTDPDRFMLIEKVQVLQKQIMKHQIEAIKRENVIQESHKLYLSTKTYMEKLPTFKVKEELCKNQFRVRTKEKKMKALAAELTTKEMDVKAKDCELDEMKKSLTLCKNELFKERKERLKLLDKMKPRNRMNKWNDRNNINDGSDTARTC